MAGDITSAINAYASSAKLSPTNNGPDQDLMSLSPSGQKVQGSSFEDLVEHSIDESIDTARRSESLSMDAMANKAELHELVTAVSQAELTVQTVVAVRDKVITAYQEIIKMPI